MSSFDNFEQQERSWSYLQDLGTRLAAEAVQLLADRPDGALAGLILESGAPEFERMRGAIAAAVGHEVSGPGFLGVVSRSVALEIVVANAGAEAVRWMETNAPHGGPLLPIVVATKDGFRMAAVPMAADSES